MANSSEMTSIPQVKLGDYKNIYIPRKIAEVTEEDIEAAKEELRYKNREEMRMLQRPVEEGDVVAIDFDGFIDGVAFEGGKGESYDLEIGSHSFIDTFEEQLIGHSAGECVNVNVRFPDNYPAAETAGKEALFKVTIKEIKGYEVPDFGITLVTVATEFNTIEEFLEDAKEKILAKKQDQLDIARENAILTQIIQNSEITIPQDMIDTRAGELFEAYVSQIKAAGMDFSKYLEYVGMNDREFLESLKPEAKNYLECRCVLKAIAGEEGISVSEKELDGEIEKVAELHNSSLRQVKEMMDDENKALITEDLLIQKTMRFLLDR